MIDDRWTRRFADQIVAGFQAVNDRQERLDLGEFAWACGLVPGSYDDGLFTRACWDLVTLEGERLALTEPVVLALQQVGLWLCGHTPASVHWLPTQSPDRPLEALYLTQELTPTPETVERFDGTIKTHMKPGDAHGVLIFTTYDRPATLPR